MSGTYTIYATNGVCPDTKTLALTVVPYPSFTITPASATICQGGSVSLSANLAFGNNPSNFSFNWFPLNGGGVFSPYSQNTAIYPPLLPSNITLATVPYSVTVSSTLLSCPITKTVGITINNPLTPSLTMPPPLCDIFSPVTLTASPSTGTWVGQGNNAVTPGGLFTPAFANNGINTVMYSISIGTCIVNNTGTISVSQFNTAALSGSLSMQCVQDPTVNLMGLVQNTLTGYWTGGPYVNANIFNPAGLATGNYSLVYNTFSTPDPTVCPSSTVLNVSVFDPPIPVIRPIKPFCNTSPQTALTATPSGGVWSVVSGVTSAGIVTPSSCAIPNNTVAYTAGIGTCVATSTANFSVSRFNTAALTGTMPNLCVTSRPVNLMSIVQSSVQGVWTGPNVVSTYSFNPLGLPTGTFVLTYSTMSAPDPTLCPDVSTIAVSVLNPVVPSITMVGPYCNKASAVQMSVTPNTGSWTAMPYLSPTGVFTPSLASIGSNPVQYVTGTSTCNVQQTKFINIEAFVSAAIINKIPDQCVSNSGFNLQPITLNGSGTWGGTGVTGTNFYPAMSGAGSYVLTYSTASVPSGLCPDQSTVAVNVFSLATPVINNAGPFCNTTPVQQLLVSPVGGIFGGANTSAVSTKGQFNPAFAILGNNIVNYSISAGPCIAFAQATIMVEKFVSANFATAQKLNFCQGDNPVNMFTYVENGGGTWSAYPAIDAGSSMFNPVKANLGDNVVTYQTFSSPDATLCPDSKTIVVTVNETPSIALVRSNNTNSCVPVELTLEMKTSSLQPLSGYGYWKIGDGSPDVNGLKISHTFTAAGEYTPVASFVTDKGCKAQAILKPAVTVFETPKAAFIYEPDVITTANPEVYLSNLSTGKYTNIYQWSVTGYSKIYEVNPKLTLPQIGLYRVTLSATSINGCKDEISKIIEVKNDFNAFIPNSFSPNGDGINDVFKPVFSPYGLDTKGYEFEIYDRWGAKLFSSNDPNKAWDGTQHNLGIACLKQDTYIYTLKYKDLNGKGYFRTGNVTLLGN
jgi:gliding motility-associated-like protein